MPQELGRDDRAISFVKGCYLGQETVARLDALGRVNWLFVGLILPAGETYSAGQEIEQDGKQVLRITSVIPSPGGECFWGLGYARRGHHESGTKIGGIEIR